MLVYNLIGDTSFMKVAIVHDHFLYFGGAERVLLSLLKIFSQADVYLAFASQQWLSVVKKSTSGKVFVSPFNKLPFVQQSADWYKPIIFTYWEHLVLAKYDLVVSSSHSYSSKSVCVSRGTPHMSYVLTPPRFLYEEFNETQWLKKMPWRMMFGPFLSRMRQWDYKSAQRPDVLIASSKTVQDRMRRYYKRDSIVIYPPVAIPRKLPKRDPRYYVCVSRLVKQKGIDLAIRACNKLRAPLVVVGKGAEEGRLRAAAGKTITFRGFVSDEKMADVYAGAKALIFPAIDEDFGIIPVEAMAHGVPVIAYNSGGIRETVIDGKTGILFREYTTIALRNEINRLERLHFSQKTLRQHALRFSEKNFREKVREVVAFILEKQHNIAT